MSSDEEEMASLRKERSEKLGIPPSVKVSIILGAFLFGCFIQEREEGQYFSFV